MLFFFKKAPFLAVMTSEQSRIRWQGPACLSKTAGDFPGRFRGQYPWLTGPVRPFLPALAGSLGIAHTTCAKEDPKLKRSLALLLTSLLLVFSLAACGKDQQAGGVGDSASSGSVTGDTGSGSSSGGSADGSVTGGVNGGSGGPMMDGADDTMDDVGDMARDAVRDTGDALTGGTTGYTKNQMDGYTYDQMVENGRVF